MNKRIAQELLDILDALAVEYMKMGIPVPFEKYAITMLQLELSNKYSPEEISLFIRDENVKAFVAFYATPEDTTTIKN